MSLDADRIIDRRRLKRHLIFWRIATVVSLIMVGVVALERMGKLRQEVHVARLSVEGIILDDPWRDKALEQVRDNDKAKALIVRIDSPGGTVVGGEALFHGLRAMAAKPRAPTCSIHIRSDMKALSLGHCSSVMSSAPVASQSMSASAHCWP